MFLKKKFLAIPVLSLSLTLIFGYAIAEKAQLQPKAQAESQLTTNEPSFGLPIACNLGDDCFIMLYVDRDPSEGEIDFGCGRQTYDTHKGTDFAIADLKAMKKGVPVIAAASGKVLRVRDSVPDKLVENESDREAVEDIECGNGLVIAHDHEWETQYCHLRQGSLQVKPGATVDKGDILGLVGASGLASFPHVHLSVRYQGKVVDPFVGVTTQSGCQVQRNSLWAEELTYTPTGLIEAGFADQPPTQKQLWQGKYKEISLSNDIGVLIFWVHAYGVLAGDVETFKLISPEGRVIINDQNTIEKSSKTWMRYVGKRNKEKNSLPSGVWRGEYQLKRGDRILIDINRELNLL